VDLSSTNDSKPIRGGSKNLVFELLFEFAFIKAENSDRYGNLSYSKTARNFNPIMSMAAKQTIVQVKNIVGESLTDPEKVITPGIFVDKIVEVNNPIIETNAIDNGEVYP